MSLSTYKIGHLSIYKVIIPSILFIPVLITQGGMTKILYKVILVTLVYRNDTVNALYTLSVTAIVTRVTKL